MKTKKWTKTELAFYIGTLAVPVVQVLLFYIYVNFNSIMLSFKEYTQVEGTELWEYSFNGFSNYVNVIKDMFDSSVLQTAMGNSLKLFFFTLIFGVFLSSIFAYYIYKKQPLSQFFRMVLFIPQIVSSVIMVLIFKYVAEELVPEMARIIFGVERMKGLLTNADTQFGAVLFYSVFISYGANLLLFSGAMSEINESVIEAGKLDGVNVFQEYIHIIFPSIWPTMITLVVVSIAGIFANQANLYTLYGTNAEYSIQVMGYYMYSKTSVATYADYPYLAAMGVIFTLVLFPITMFVRKAMYKYGPSVE